VETKQRIALAAAASAAIGPVAAEAVFPDAAAAVPPFCRGNAVCLYRDNGFAGTIAAFSGGDDNYAAHDGFAANTYVNGQPLNDSVSSVWNNTNRYVRLCVNAGCSPNPLEGYCLGPGAALNLPQGFADRISAHQFNPALSSCFDIRTGPQGCSI
jgi:hypothetical protein